MKVLMIFYSFAPQNNCAAIPNTKLTKYLGQEDVEITLITNSLLPDMEIDESLLSENIRAMRRFQVERSKIFIKTVAAQRTKLTNSGTKLKMKSEKRKFRAWCVSVIKNVYFDISGFDWITSAVRLVKKELKGEVFDIVYSSYPSKETHELAKYIVRNGIAKKWVADFRDPMYYAEYDKHRYKRKLKRQHTIEKMADHVTVVSEGAKEKFLFRDVPQEKITYISNGYDPDDFNLTESRQIQNGNVLRFFYAGQLYAGRRDLTPLFQAIHELHEEGLVDEKMISLEYAGNEWPIFLEFAEKFQLSDITVNYGFVTRKKVMEIMSEIDCSIVATHNTATDKGVVTGKIFELLLVEKPVVALVSGDVSDSELGEIVKECNAGVVYEESRKETDYPGLKKWVLDSYNEKLINKQLNLEINKDARDQYSYARIANKLYRIFFDLMRN